MKTLDTSNQAGASRTVAETANARLGGATAPHRTENIDRIVDSDGICILNFDRANSSANIFDRATLLELDSHLDAIEHIAGLCGVVIASAKENIFIAGADIHALAGMADLPAAAPASASGETSDTSPVLTELMQLGQGVFNRLAALTVPTVAAIHGACVGGGYELALACGYRLATSERVTKIGLPEVLLGILPAWGGSTRLPRLIGIPKALDIVLAGKTLPADRALKLGMIDELIPRARLMEVARDRILKPVKPHRPSVRVSNNPVSAMLIRSRVTRQLAAKTRGNYPAPFEALDVVTHGVSLSLEKSLEREREAILRLSRTEACHNLLRLFLLKERAKKSHGAMTPVSRTAVIGAGVMGAGIAQWLSARGLSVILRDVSLDQLVRGMATVSSLYEDAVKHHHLTALEARDGKDRIFAAATDLPMRDVDIVIEAATEKLPLKQDIFRVLAAQTGPRTILATNTSALSVTDIAAATKAAERVVGLHFFNPVHRMELIEIVAGEKTSPEVVSRVTEFARRIGKVPIVVRDSPGFVVNRILMPYLVEAVRLFDAGASAHDIDEAMLDFGMPMGPLRLLDEVGLDVAAHVVNTLAKKFGELVTAPALIEKMLGAGMFGKKSGRGFYDYAHDKPNHELEVMRSVHRHAHFTHDELTQRLSLLMINEAARCVEEKVATTADIDLGMVLGTGFAPFHGGPLRYADTLGVPNVVAEMEKFAATEPRFAPCKLLKQMAETNALFFPPKGANA
ncbi:MAG TPA: 3-hydroxyacyl-CoA dehydrogenase NAD-binding domain-containing protein [Verrucomicrobiae bacterium]|jgi:3-hydroxyacyl-CoA dehydrogenase/enoyl-CoA hydratase/3-hydroxybutyryl-CoA epimerase